MLKIPKLMVHDVLAKLHGDGHVSSKRMEILARQQYDITRLTKRIGRLVANCIPCILATKLGKRMVFLSLIDKYDHILVMVDAFTKFNWLYPVKSTKAVEAVNKLRLNSENFGHPKRIIADKGAAFVGKEFEDRKRHLATSCSDGDAARQWTS